jgi:hypothetical protein
MAETGQQFCELYKDFISRTEFLFKIKNTYFKNNFVKDFRVLSISWTIGHGQYIFFDFMDIAHVTWTLVMLHGHWP